jgi:two-component system sensor histidine kinase TctE
VTQLLVLAKSESISDMAFGKVMDLSIITKECAKHWVPKALSKNINMTFDAPTYPTYILCDETLIWELISNLLSNSICYGRYNGNIDVKIVDDKDVFLISIKDDGVGIHDDELQHVFKRFYRISGSAGSGCGLGLAIVKEIANIHKASITIISDSFCEGTTVKIAFKKYFINGT